LVSQREGGSRSAGGFCRAAEINSSRAGREGGDVEISFFRAASRSSREIHLQLSTGNWKL